MKRFSDDFFFYWRILKDTRELEGVMVVNDTSWVGVGWRPSSLTPECRAFPEIHGKSDAEPLPKPEPKFERTPQKTSPVSEPIPEPSKAAAKRRSAKPHADLVVTPRIDSDVTVQTSVTYRVSTKQGLFGDN